MIAPMKGSCGTNTCFSVFLVLLVAHACIKRVKLQK